jgi:hypothetical protein
MRGCNRKCDFDALPLGLEQDADKKAILKELRRNGDMLRSIRKQKGSRDAMNYRDVMCNKLEPRDIVPEVARAVSELRHAVLHPIDWAAICFIAIAAPCLHRYDLEKIALHLGADEGVILAAFGWLPAIRPDGTMSDTPFVHNLARGKVDYRVARPKSVEQRAALDLFLAGRDPALRERIVDVEQAA